MKYKVWLVLGVIAAAAVLLWLLLMRPFDRDSAPGPPALSPARKAHADLLGRVLAEDSPDMADDAEITFEAVNKWQAPMVDLTSGNVFVWSEENVFQDPGYYDKDSIRVAELLLSDRHMLTFGSLIGSERDKLMTDISSAGREVFGNRLGAASVLCLMSVVSHPDDSSNDENLSRVRVSPYSLPLKPRRFDARRFESGPGIVQKGDFFYLVVQGFDDPFLPFRGKEGITWENGWTKFTVLRRECISFSGARFRCFVVKGFSSGEDLGPTAPTVTKMSWLAPGIGLVYEISVKYFPMDGKTIISTLKIQELLLPGPKIHWRSDGATHE